MFSMVPALFLNAQMFGPGLGSAYKRDPVFLYTPCVENIDPEGGDTLKFRWSSTNRATVRYYDLKIYKGYDTKHDNLLIHKTLYGNDTTADIPVDTFEKGNIYSWALYYVLYGGLKSGKSYCSFSVGGE